MKLKINKILFIAIFFTVGCFFSGCSLNKTAQETRGLFSWKDSEVLEGRAQLYETMKDLKLNTIYQSFSEDLQEKDILNFVREATDKKISVYLLTGAPQWALEESGETMLSEVEKVININKSLEKSAGIKGVLFDVEPYLLDEWDKQSREKIMDGLVANMKKTYEKAHENGLEVIACIPYFYDDFGFSQQVEELIKASCDSLAVMNYYQGKEQKHIENEEALTNKYGKELINIYEMQAPGKHGLIDKNTYHEEGLNSVEKNFAELKKSFNGRKISIAFHDYAALKEIIGNE
ncbi:hypothetical protein [Clostridium tunisiense]|uniref:hypothetical protein n=1 Tax=Clostridium tunisiense TaxID=219748 RepID=UPI0002F2239C|nr:hypothetical protein [Clostridium tunisiense]